VRSARVRAQWAADAIASVGTTGAEFDTFIQAEQARWKPVLARARIRAKS
jgi:tripartite-type tricarboxylate transporter receptor subunit TctC